MTENRVPQPGEPLTARELQVVRLVADGQSNQEIGEALHLSPLTVKAHLARVAAKLGTGDRAGIVGAAFRTRQLPLVRSGRDVELDERLTATLIRIARGMSNAEIAADLFLSEHTVKSRVAVLMRELGVRDRAAAVRVGLEWGALTLVSRQASERPVGLSARRCPPGARESVSVALRPSPGAIPSNAEVSR